MDIKLDKDSKEYEKFIKALNLVNFKIDTIVNELSGVIDKRKLDSMNNELHSLLKDRDDICQFDIDIIDKILTKYNN